MTAFYKLSLLWVVYFLCSLKVFLFTHGEAIKAQLSNGTSRPSFKVDWFPPVFDIEIVKASGNWRTTLFREESKRNHLRGSVLPKKSGVGGGGCLSGKSYLHIKKSHNSNYTSFLFFSYLWKSVITTFSWSMMVLLVYWRNLLSHL